MTVHCRTHPLIYGNDIILIDSLLSIPVHQYWQPGIRSSQACHRCYVMCRFSRVKSADDTRNNEHHRSVC
jgi:hypothetical protein